MVQRRQQAEKDLFEPLRPAHGAKLVAAALIGPAAWVVAWLVAAWLFTHTHAIQLGLLVTGLSFAFALPILALMTWGRRREERRFEQDGRRFGNRP